CSENTTFSDAVKARAWRDAADSAACGSVWTRTREKSHPKRGSKKSRVDASSGWPDELSTWVTTGGRSFLLAASLTEELTVSLLACEERLFLHESHSPPASV